LRLYDDDTKAHSEHDTDPARGQSNAFDLVRLHRFGALDTPEVEALSITERPSYKAMCKLALEQPEVRAAMIAEDFVDLGPVQPVEVDD
jgi:putative DNA primase/helicase